MSLNDPFGRVSRRQNDAYRRLRDQLRQQGIVTPPAVRQAQHRLRQTSLRLLAIIIAAAALGGVLFPDLRAVIAVTIALVLLWLGSSYLQTRTHLNTYLRAVSDAGSRETRHNPDITTEKENQP